MLKLALILIIAFLLAWEAVGSPTNPRRSLIEDQDSSSSSNVSSSSDSASSEITDSSEVVSVRTYKKLSKRFASGNRRKRTVLLYGVHRGPDSSSSSSLSDSTQMSELLSSGSEVGTMSISDQGLIRATNSSATSSDDEPLELEDEALDGAELERAAISSYPILKDDVLKRSVIDGAEDDTDDVGIDILNVKKNFGSYDKDYPHGSAFEYQRSPRDLLGDQNYFSDTDDSPDFKRKEREIPPESIERPTETPAPESESESGTKEDHGITENSEESVLGSYSDSSSSSNSESSSSDSSSSENKRLQKRSSGSSGDALLLQLQPIQRRQRRQGRPSAPAPPPPRRSRSRRQYSHGPFDGFLIADFDLRRVGRSIRSADFDESILGELPTRRRTDRSPDTASSAPSLAEPAEPTPLTIVIPVEHKTNESTPTPPSQPVKIIHIYTVESNSSDSSNASETSSTMESFGTTMTPRSSSESSPSTSTEHPEPCECLQQVLNPPPPPPPPLLEWGPVVPIIQKTILVNPDGTFLYSLEAGDGRAQNGPATAPQPPAAAPAMEGYRYAVPDGDAESALVSLRFLPDEQSGFRSIGELDSNSEGRWGAFVA